MTALKKVSVSILVPVYNEERTVAEILQTTARLPIDSYQIIIVDDASRDSTPQIISAFKKSHKSKHVEIKTFTHAYNRGKGAAIQTGLTAASGEYFVIQDADLEYDPRDIPRLLQRAQQGELDAVYGSRFLGRITGMSKVNYFANKCYNRLLRLLYRTRTTDMHTCYKMVRTDLLKELNITSNGFDYATELVSKLLKRGVVIYEVPINFRGRTKQEGKKIDVLDGIECAYKLVRFRFSHKDRLFGEKSTTFWRFLIVGTIGFISNYLVLVLLDRFFGLHHATAEALAAFVALQVTFLLHDRWTYMLHTPSGTARLGLSARYLGYLASNSVGAVITVLAFSLLYPHLTRLAALFLAALAALAWNYFMNTYVIWRRSQRTD